MNRGLNQEGNHMTRDSALKKSLTKDQNETMNSYDAELEVKGRELLQYVALKFFKITVRADKPEKHRGRWVN